MKQFIICDPFDYISNLSWKYNYRRLEYLRSRAVWYTKGIQYNRTIVRIMHHDKEMTRFGYSGLNEGHIWIFELNDRVRSMLKDNQYVIFEADEIRVVPNEKAARSSAGDYCSAYDIYGNGKLACTIEYMSDRMD